MPSEKPPIVEPLMDTDYDWGPPLSPAPDPLPPTTNGRRRFNGNGPHPTVDTEPVVVSPLLVWLSDTQSEDVMWIWPGRLAAGKLALLVGDPGLGKSWITLDVAAHVSEGSAWTLGALTPTIGTVLVLHCSTTTGKR